MNKYILFVAEIQTRSRTPEASHQINNNIKVGTGNEYFQGYCFFKIVVLFFLLSRLLKSGLMLRDIASLSDIVVPFASYR